MSVKEMEERSKANSDDEEQKEEQEEENDEDGCVHVLSPCFHSNMAL